jgi:hypothetical protein
MPRDFARSRRRDLAKSAGSGEPVFTSMDTGRTVALKRPIFKQKKGYATIGLGLNYHFMGSSQPPPRDSVPFMMQLRNPPPTVLLDMFILVKNNYI